MLKVLVISEGKPFNNESTYYFLNLQRKEDEEAKARQMITSDLLSFCVYLLQSLLSLIIALIYYNSSEETDQQVYLTLILLRLSNSHMVTMLLANYRSRRILLGQRRLRWFFHTLIVWGFATTSVAPHLTLTPAISRAFGWVDRGVA
jgi:hypothetical protein